MAAAARRQQQRPREQPCRCESGCSCGGAGSGGGGRCTCGCASCGTACNSCCCKTPCCGSGCSCSAAGRHVAQIGSGRGATPGAPAALPAEAAVRGMLPDIATLLEAGLRHLVLTLGAEGAALCTLAPGRQEVDGERAAVDVSSKCSCRRPVLPCQACCFRWPSRQAHPHVGLPQLPLHLLMQPAPCSPPGSRAACQRRELQRRRGLPSSRQPLRPGAGSAAGAGSVFWHRGCGGCGAEPVQRASWAECCASAGSSSAGACQQRHAASAAAGSLQLLLRCLCL